MIDIRQAILDALPRELLIDLEDRLRAEAAKAHEVVKRELPLNAKRGREAEGQIRFRLQEQGYEEVVQAHGGLLIVDGVSIETTLRVFQPFARFRGADVGVILGFATMPERKKIPPKNMSRAAGVRLNVGIQPGLFVDDKRPQSTDIFALFLTARDRERAGMIEEIAIGVIGADYKDFVFYQSLDEFMSGYSAAPASTAEDDKTDQAKPVVKLKTVRKPFIPPENLHEDQAEDGSGG